MTLKNSAARSFCNSGFNFFFLFLLPLSAFCQAPGMELYQYNYTSINPAFAGTDEAKATAMGSYFHYNRKIYGWNFQYFSSYAGFEMPLRKINCGTGVNAVVYQNAFGHWGPVSKGAIVNVPFNYQLKIDDDRMVSFGVRLGYQNMQVGEPNNDGPWLDVGLASHRQFDPRVYDFAPVGGQLVTRRGFTSAAGMMYRGAKFYSGISVNNLAYSKRLDVFVKMFDDWEYVYRQYDVIVGWRMPWNGKVSTDHSAYFTARSEDVPMLEINNSALLFKTVIVGFTLGLHDDDANAKVNAGFQWKNYGKLVVMLYSKTRDVPDKALSGQIFLQVNINPINEPS